MRAYFFGNVYLSTIQQGIQAAHCISNIFAKYDNNHNPKNCLMEWAKIHKTMILLNGGFSSELHRLSAFFDDSQNPYPWDSFNEDKQSLNEVKTCVGIILPEKIYTAAQLLRTEKSTYGVRSYKELLWEDGEISHFDSNENPVTWTFNEWEAQLCDKLTQYSLAR